MIIFIQGRYLNTVFSQILVISVLKGLRRFVFQSSVRAHPIVKLNILLHAFAKALFRGVLSAVRLFSFE